MAANRGGFFFPLEPSDDFREFSSLPRRVYGAVEQLSLFGKIRYLFASSISLLSASSLLQSWWTEPSAQNSRKREPRNASNVCCQYPVSWSPCRSREPCACVWLSGRAQVQIRTGFIRSYSSGHGRRSWTGNMALESWKCISFHFYIWKWGWQLYCFTVFLWWFITRCK